jgi:hypothetical protein
MVKTPIKQNPSLETLTPVIFAPGTAPKTVHDVLEHAARYIEEHGWTTGVLENDLGNVCAVGAIAKVSPNSTVLFQAIRRVSNNLPGDSSVTPVHHVESWNDGLDFDADLGRLRRRREDEVVAALRWSAKRTVAESE